MRLLYLVAEGKVADRFLLPWWKAKPASLKDSYSRELFNCREVCAHGKLTW